MTLNEQSVRLPNGVTLRYVEQGPVEMSPVILLHGYTDSLLSFEPVLAHLPSSIRAIALSLRGHGSSDKPANGYDPRDLAADLAEFMRLRRIRSAIVAGHSMGSAVAQCFALDHPEKTRGLALIGTFMTLRGNAELSEMSDQLSNMEDPIDLDFVRAFQVSTLAQPVPAEFFATVVAESARLPARVWRAVLRRLLQFDLSQDLDLIGVPTVIFWGERDSLSSYEEQQELEAAIPGAELRVYAGAGHALHWEEPRRFAEDLANFVRSLEAPSVKEMGQHVC